MASAVKPYDRVRIVTDRFHKDGAPAGTIGYILDEWQDGWFEVEVSREDGTTITVFAANRDDLQPAEDEEHYRHRCPDCEGKRRCDTCGGTGRWSGGDICPYCGGDGVCYHYGGKGFVTEAD